MIKILQKNKYMVIVLSNRNCLVCHWLYCRRNNNMKKWLKNILINIVHSRFFDEDQRDFSHQSHTEYEKEEQRKANILMSKMSMTQKYMIAVDVLESQIQMAEDRVKQEATSDNEDGTQLWLDQLFQLRNGKVYIETMRDMIYGSKELIELDIEHTHD